MAIRVPASVWVIAGEDITFHYGHSNEKHLAEGFFIIGKLTLRFVENSEEG